MLQLVLCDCNGRFFKDCKNYFINVDSSFHVPPSIFVVLKVVGNAFEAISDLLKFYSLFFKKVFEYIFIRFFKDLRKKIVQSVIEKKNYTHCHLTAFILKKNNL